MAVIGAVASRGSGAMLAPSSEPVAMISACWEPVIACAIDSSRTLRAGASAVAMSVSALIWSPLEPKCSPSSIVL